MATKAAAKNALADLFGEAELQSKRNRVSRSKVDVPPQVFKVLQEAQASGKNVVYPVTNQLAYEAMADVFFSAGELLNASCTPAPVKDTGKVDSAGNKVYEVVKNDPENWLATHVRVTVGKRRGRAAAKQDDQNEQSAD